jgi:PAS domain S-box-containing protein
MKYILQIDYLRNILIVSSIIAIALPICVIMFIYPSFNKQLTKNVESEAVSIARHLSSMIMADLAELSPDTLSNKILYDIKGPIKDFGLMKLKIFSKSGEIIFSTDSKDVGVVNKEKYFHNIVAKGKTYTEVVKKDTKSLEYQTVKADVVETYVPIIKDDTFIGAFEIYYNISERQERLDNLLFRSSVVLIILATSLFGVILTVLFKAAKNIIEREKAELTLLKNEEKYRLLVNNIPSVVYRGYKDWSVEFIDRKLELLAGYDVDEFNAQEMKWSDIIVEEDIKVARKSFIQALKTDKSYVREYRIKSKDGGIRWIQDRGQIVCDEKGEIEYISGVFFDITEHKRTEEEREKLVKELQESLKEIKTLRGILPLCSFCKKIRDDKGYWEQVDVYIHKHLQADISHSICPDCAKEHYPDLDIHE